MIFGPTEFAVRWTENSHLTVTGDLDLHSRSAFQSALDSAPPGTLTVDLAALRFIDAAGLGTFVRLAADRTLRLRNPSAGVARVFAMASLASLLDTGAAPAETV